MCLTQAKGEATSVRKKGQLKMIEIEQNLKKILAKVHRKKRPKMYIKKNKTYQYIVKAAQMPNSNIS